MNTKTTLTLTLSLCLLSSLSYCASHRDHDAYLARSRKTVSFPTKKETEFHKQQKQKPKRSMASKLGLSAALITGVVIGNKAALRPLDSSNDCAIIGAEIAATWFFSRWMIQLPEAIRDIPAKAEKYGDSVNADFARNSNPNYPGWGPVETTFKVAFLGVGGAFIATKAYNHIWPTA